MTLIFFWIYGLLLLLHGATSFSVLPRRHHGIDTCSSCCVWMGKTVTAQRRLDQRWFPRENAYDEDDIYGAAQQEDMKELEEQSLKLLASLISKAIQRRKESTTTAPPDPQNKAYQMAKGKFLDLTCTEQGEAVLESLFDDPEAAQQYQDDSSIVLGAITALQSLCITGTQVGVKGTPEQLQRMVAHLESPEGDEHVNVWAQERNSVRQLKYNVDQTAGTQLLALLKRKRNPKGAFDVLVDIGAWEKHENLSLLRSGFPIRFTPQEEVAALEATRNTRDPDTILGIRRDFRTEKIYTIDSASTSEIDDGLSLEVIMNEDGSTRQRIWVHVSDADQWAPRDSQAFHVAARRATSLYLPSGTIPMFPSMYVVLFCRDLLDLRSDTR